MFERLKKAHFSSFMTAMIAAILGLLFVIFPASMIVTITRLVGFVVATYLDVRFHFVAPIALLAFVHDAVAFRAAMGAATSDSHTSGGQNQGSEYEGQYFFS